MAKGLKEIRKSREEFLVYIILAATLILVLVAAIKITQKSIEEKEKCVIQNTGCCSCSMGGKQECMTVIQAEETQKRLDKECRSDMLCIAVDMCEKIECIYDDGICKRKQ